MIKAIKPFLIAASVTVLLSACASSDDVHYYTLTPSQTGEMTADPWPYPYRLVVAPFPGQVTDTPIVVRQSNDQLMLLSHDRWSSTPREQMQQALAQSLTTRLGMPPVQDAASSGARDPAQIRVQVQDFDMLPGKRAILDVSWQIQATRPKRNLTCHAILSHDSEPGVVPLVRAQQMNVQSLGGQIAATMRRGQPLSGARCVPSDR